MRRVVPRVVKAKDRLTKAVATGLNVAARTFTRQREWSRIASKGEKRGSNVAGTNDTALLVPALFFQTTGDFNRRLEENQASLHAR